MAECWGKKNTSLKIRYRVNTHKIQSSLLSSRPPYGRVLSSLKPSFLFPCQLTVPLRIPAMNIDRLQLSHLRLWQPILNHYHFTIKIALYACWFYCCAPLSPWCSIKHLVSGLKDTNMVREVMCKQHMVLPLVYSQYSMDTAKISS